MTSSLTSRAPQPSIAAEPSPTSRRWVLGADIGGTFTDFALFDRETGALAVAKVLSDPATPEAAVFEGIRRLEESQPGFLADTEVVVHGTTLAINALIERSGPAVAMLVTEGFADILEMRTGSRGDMWDLSGRLPAPLIPRSMRIEIRERVTATGSVHEAVSAASLNDALRMLSAVQPAAVAVCFLHSYIEPANERVAIDALLEHLPGFPVTCSSDVLPAPGEFARFSATAANAYLIPILSHYLPRLRVGLEDRGLRQAGLRVLTSEGSQAAPEVAARLPVRFVESGPVGGVIAARHIAQDPSGSVLTLDVGGTTAKTALIEDGVIPLSEEYEVAREYRFAVGSGIPLNVPSVDLLEVGAGGGSIASVDALGLVQVGPRSAGSIPGPACYGRGGVEPTVTDADVVLGLLDPDIFAAPQGIELSRRAIANAVAASTDTSVAEAAMRVREVALATMALGIQKQLARAGSDTSKMTLVAFGGAGPLMAADLARILGIRQAVIPPAASVFSALGMAIAPDAFTSVRAVRSAASGAIDPETLRNAYADATAEALEALRLADDSIGPDDTTTAYALDVRYAGQGQPITVPVGRIPVIDPPRVRDLFETEYARRFVIAHPDQRVEVVGVRATVGRERLHSNALLRMPPVAGNHMPATRTIFAGTEQTTEAAVYQRGALRPGWRAAGPVLIEDVGTTVYVPVRAQARVTENGTIRLEIAP